MLTISLGFLHICTVTAVQEHVLDRVFYWDIKPFIFFNKETRIVNDKNLDGIFLFTYTKLIDKCFNSSLPSDFSENLPDFKLISYTEKEFYKMLENTNDSEIRNGDNRIWFPIFLKINKPKLEAKHLKFDTFIKSQKVAVIVHKDKLTLLNKVLEAIKLSLPIVTIAGVFILLFSTLLWLAITKRNGSITEPCSTPLETSTQLETISPITTLAYISKECITNKDFSKCFVNGFGTSLWWSIVTLATVGYGDIVPKSFIGRFISVAWMMIGVLIIAGLTGTFTSIITNNSFLSIQDKEVAALNNSMDFEIAKRNYNSILKGFESYDEVLRAVNNKTNHTEYGVVNIDVLLNMDFKKKHPNVRLVKLIDAATPVFIVYGNKTKLMVDPLKGDDFAECMQNNIKDTKDRAQDIYEIIPIIDTETPQNLFESIKAMWFPVIFTLCVVFALAVKDVVQFAYKKRYGKDVSLTVFFNGPKSDEKKSTEKDVPLADILNSNKNDLKKSAYKDDLFDELTRKKEHIKLKANYEKKKDCLQV